MSHAIVEQILDMIDALPAKERELLEQRLAERLEAEWQDEAVEARQQVEAHGIDQTAIDAAVHRYRYGS